MSDDLIFDAIRKGHEEESKAEFHQQKMDRFPGDLLSELYDLNLSTNLISKDTEQSIQILQAINQNIFELHETQKHIRSYSKMIALGVFFIAGMLVKEIWL